MARPAADAQVLTNNPDKDLMEKDNDERNVRDEGENQEQNIKRDLDNDERNQEDKLEPDNLPAVLAWTAARLLALPVEVSLPQVERPFLGPPRGKAPPRP